MRLVIYLEHVLHGELRIALRRGEPLVAKQFLNGTQVCALFEHVRTESVTQGVRMHIGREALCHCDLLDDASHAARGQTTTALIDEQCRAVLARVR